MKNIFNDKKIIIPLVIAALLVSLSGYAIFNSISKGGTKTESQANAFVVSFESMGGTFINSQTVSLQDKVKKPEDPTKAGFAFEGWELDGELYDFSVPIVKDIVLTAVWNDDGITSKVMVTFNANGGSETKTIEITENTILTPPLNPTKSGQVFKGWYCDGKLFDFSLPIFENTTLEAQWEKVSTANNSSGNNNANNNVNNQNPSNTNPVTNNSNSDVNMLTVTFFDSGILSTQTVERGKTVSKPANPKPKNPDFPVFHYWIDSDTGEEFNFSTPITSNKTLGAVWGSQPQPQQPNEPQKPNEPQQPIEKTFTATFKKNGATKIGASSLSCKTTGNSCTITAPTISLAVINFDTGKTVTLSYNPNYSGADGNVFGWSTNANETVLQFNPNNPNEGSSRYSPNQAIELTGDETFYAITRKVFTARWYFAGVTITNHCYAWNAATSCNIKVPSGESFWDPKTESWLESTGANNVVSMTEHRHLYRTRS